MQVLPVEYAHVQNFYAKSRQNITEAAAGLQPTAALLRAASLKLRTEGLWALDYVGFFQAGLSRRVRLGHGLGVPVTQGMKLGLENESPWATRR